MSAATILLPWPHLGHPSRMGQSPGSLQALTLSQMPTPSWGSASQLTCILPCRHWRGCTQPSRAETTEQCQLGTQAGRGTAEPILHRCRKAVITQRHQHTQHNRDLLQYRFPELLPTSPSDENPKCLKPQEGLCTPKNCYQASAGAGQQPKEKNSF